MQPNKNQNCSIETEMKKASYQTFSYGFQCDGSHNNMLSVWRPFIHVSLYGVPSIAIQLI